MAWPSLLYWKKEKQTEQINNLKPQLQTKIRFKSEKKECKDPSNYFVYIYCWLPLSFQTSCYSRSRGTRIYMKIKIILIKKINKKREKERKKNIKFYKMTWFNWNFQVHGIQTSQIRIKVHSIFKKINRPTQLWNSDLGTDFAYCKCLGFASNPHCSLLLKQEALTQSSRLPSFLWATEIFLSSLWFSPGLSKAISPSASAVRQIHSP